MNHYPKLPVSIFRLSPVSVAHGAEGFEDFCDVFLFGAEELFGEGLGGDGGVGGAEGGFDGFGAVGQGFGPGPLSNFRF